MDPRIEEDHPSIVAVGGFDPRRFQPSWFRQQKLLGESEAEQATVRILSDQIVDWSTEWFDMQVLQNRLAVIARVGSRSESLRDLWIGILELLEQTRIDALGLNRSMHLTVGEENWHKIGHALAPKEVWAPHLKRPGLITLQIDSPERHDGLNGRAVISVQPSGKYSHAVYFDVNNELRPKDAPEAAKLIRDNWHRVFREAYDMAVDVLAKAAQ